MSTNMDGVLGFFLGITFVASVFTVTELIVYIRESRKRQREEKS